MSGGVLRAMGWIDAPTEPPQIGAAVAPAVESFAPRASMSAFAEFPWVRACVDAIAEDLSGLPLRLTLGDGPDAKVVDHHPVLDLFARPTSQQGRRGWERQLITYWLPTGSAVVLLLGGRRPTSLVLLHPEHVRPVADEFGGLAGVQFRSPVGGDRYYAADTVAVVSSSSWRPAAEALVGEGAIAPLKTDLNAEHHASMLTASTASRGRPDVILTPTDTAVQLTVTQRQAIAEAYANWSRSKSGAFVVSGAMKAEFPAFTPRDLEFSEQRKLTRETVLAVFGVPPSRVGLPTANYATQKQQNETYWQNLQAKAALLDDAYTAIARRFDSRLTLRHDFSQVPALQESRSSRLERVSAWAQLGADPAAAAAYEGFADAPLMESAAEPAPAPAPEPAKSLAGVFARAALPDDEEGRAVLWRAWEARVHRPAQAAFARRAGAALRAQRDRVAKRAEGIPIGMALTRDLVSSILDILYPPDETVTWTADLRRAVAEAIKAGYADGAEQLGRDWSISGHEADVATDRQLAELVTHTDATTKGAIRAAVLASIDQGETTHDLVTRIREATAFAPSRALAIARTETTRSLGHGHAVVYARYAEEEGVTVRQQWLSARNKSVRQAHRLLDGQVVDIGANFVVPAGEYAGHEAAAPGGFAAAALCVNCVCTTVPIVESDE